MNTYVPNYYKRFKCIADKCTHSCCIGWEIDIDPETLGYYNSLEGEISSLLNKNISYGEDAHFILKEGDRCPFLRDNGLCHLICELGEDSLCDICKDHPRFRNFYSGGVEMGLGLCCEAAAEIILNSTEDFSLEGEGDIYDSKEKYFVNVRNNLISIMQNKEKNIKERFDKMLNSIDASLPHGDLNKWVDFFLSLERLDENWTYALMRLKDSGVKNLIIPQCASLPLENLGVYFLYRHTPSSLWDDNLSSKVMFSFLATSFIHTLAKTFENEFESYTKALCEYARMFSSEIEYSDENLSLIFDELLMW